MSILLAFRGGQLTLLEEVGSGATSRVWTGLYSPRNEPLASLRVAVKVGRSAADQQLLATEVERLLWSHSFGTARLVDAGRVRSSSNAAVVAPDTGCLVLSWVGSESLACMDFGNEERAFQRALCLARDIGEALGDLHQAGFAHGDVKPANIVAKEGVPDGEPGRFVLVDLGLSDAADNPQPRGATPRYLAPEVFGASAKGDGRTRDIWALGVVLADTARGQEPSRSAISALLAAELDEPLRSLIRSCLAPNPGARASARWVARLASKALQGQLSHEAARGRRIERLRRAYLQVRRAAITSAARYAKVEFAVTGTAKQWVESAVLQLGGLFELRGDAPLDGTARILPSSPLDRQRVLANLVGPIATNWPVNATESEDAWLEHWLSLCDTSDELGWTLSSPSNPQSFPLTGGNANVIEVGLELGAGRYDPPLLEAAEQLAATAQVPSAFRVVLAKRLRATGEWARAAVVLASAGDALGRAEAAETLRRMGDRTLALETSAPLLSHPDPVVVARARATHARALLDEGKVDDAAACIAAAPISSAVCETQALVQLAQGERDLARETIRKGRALPAGDEEHARLEGLIGMLEHADGSAESSRIAFRQAVDLSTRSGAVLEEATYLTGLSNACVNCGAIGDAIAASERAIALFEVMRRPSEAARAALNLVAAHAELGRQDETRSAFDFAVTLAQQAQDSRCLGYLHLALVDALPTDSNEACGLLTRAEHYLNALGADTEIWVAARRCERKLDLSVSYYDKLVRTSDVSVESRLLWWAARARRSLYERNTAEAAILLGELSPLAAVPAPIFTQGRALTAGIELAMLAGAGDIARRLAHTAAELTRRIFNNCPKELHPALEALPWICLVRGVHALPLTPEQIVDIEALVRSLGRRGELRVLLSQIVDALVLWTGVERGLLLLRAPGGRLLPRVGRNLARNDLVGEQRELSHSLAEQALAFQEPIVAVDATRELESVHASVHALKLRSVLAVPLIAHGEALGVVYLDDRVRQGAFGERELAWVRLVATIAAVAIADARDRSVLKRLARRAERAEQRSHVDLARREAELGQVRVQLAHSQQKRANRHRYAGIVGESLAMHELLSLVDRVVDSDVPVLIFGESGTGKELIARAIHENGARAKGAFVAENCSAIPETLLESALFGHTRGAFTGAVRARAGLFEIADEGTLFLDEIADMSLPMQTKLLRVLENGEVRPLGSERSRRVSVRVIGATHRNIAEMVDAGSFRQDLFYRLDVVTLSMPPLRQRYGDVPILVRHFLVQHTKHRNVGISQRALDLLSRYSWPGNVRQLENEIRRAIVLCDGEILPEHLSEEIRASQSRVSSSPEGLNLRDRISAVEFDLIQQALERTEGNLTRAAELLGLSRFGLQKMLKRFGSRLSQATGPKPEVELSGTR